MISIFYTIIEERFERSTYQLYLSKMPLAIQKNIVKYKRWQDAHASLMGKLILMDGLQAMGCTISLAELRYNEFSRPVFDGTLNFNISHSGKYVVCAISRTLQVGIDIEEVRNIDVNDFRSVWTMDEWIFISGQNQKISEFFRLWTRKEAVMKAEGIGFHLEPASIDVCSDKIMVRDKCWFLKELKIDTDYKCCIAASAPLTEDLICRKIQYS